MKILDRIALSLIIIGGLHLLLVGLVDFNILNIVFGETGETIVNVLMGISAIWCFKYFGYTPKGGSRLKDR